MHAFEYHRPEKSADAVSALKKAEDGRFLAGGQSLLPSMKQRLAAPSDLVSLSRVGELRGIKVDGKTVTIGAMTRHAEVADSAEVARAIPALAELASDIGDRQVRNVGTIGGSIANDDPSADYPAAVLALNATVVTDQRRITADDFFVDMFETALKPEELITAVEFPVAGQAAYAKFEQPASRFALVGVMVARSGSEVRVAVTGAAPSVFRVPEMEKALAKEFKASAIEGISVSPDEMMADMHGDADYRAHLVGVMARRAVDAAANR
ncbi:MAG TPA: xanthine dehydrogenase family protein subunit M [Gammaproteobacteria bacterium]|nr:xanthine dehydrogenase family protein subunit M [Gammaproteobacteria bacterium]